LMNETAWSDFVPAPASTWVHVSPPSFVRKTVPEFPTAIPVSVFMKDTEARFSLIPLIRSVQEIPPSAVWRMVPRSPTAVAVDGPVTTTDQRGFALGRGFCQNHWPKVFVVARFRQIIMPVRRVKDLMTEIFKTCDKKWDFMANFAFH
jgi:hypothetical protein